jgi:hypothetical protein
MEFFSFGPTITVVADRNFYKTKKRFERFYLSLVWESKPEVKSWWAY